MSDENEKLPSDAEHGGLKPQKPKTEEASVPPPVDEKVEKDPSEQPS